MLLSEHKVAERLTAALNDALATLAPQPFKHMADHVRAHAAEGPGAAPAAEPGAELLPRISAYLEEHAVQAKLAAVVDELAAQAPSDAVGALAQLLEAKQPRFTNTAAVRDAFVGFFMDKAAHTHWPSSPVVPHDDPTLLFINAGMNQFKKIFVGQADPASAMAKLKRAANTQKCIRAGGKHNDLDDVGKDVYHHTFFEMLGNWSFGDYFKEEAIAWAWQLLTEVYGIDPERLYVTYFEGNEALGVPPDHEARDIWGKYVPPERILAGNMKDNFWEMGDTGPCGPCSEIHYDRIGGRDASHLVNDGCVGRNGEPIPPKGTVIKGHTVGVADPNVLEIWNNVFMQFNREKDGSLTPLPAPCVDTGMGLERVASILLDKMSNYDIDVFTCIFEQIRKLCPHLPPYAGKVGPEEDPERIDMAYRVVADHIRTLTFAITDGAQPSNEGRGYVLRRILRRAVRYGGETLKAPEGFFHQLVDIVVEKMGAAFPELAKNPAAVRAVIKAEEDTFSRTLKRGIAELDKRCKKLASGSMLPGPDAFQMYDTYGFPLDLTLLMCEEKGLSVDEAGYEAEMAKAVDLSRQGGHFGDDKKIELLAEQTDALKNKMSIAATDESHKYVWDSTGSGAPLEATIKATINASKKFLDAVGPADDLVGLVLDKTPFYAEAGGQVCDLGTITSGEAEFVVEDVQKFAGYVLHIGKCTKGSLGVGQQAAAAVDYARRASIAKNHTSTHMLNYALRAALGQACDQRGSLCDCDKLRFDFAYDKPLTEEQLAATEADVNRQIEAALPVLTQVAALDGAMAIKGLRAVFGEQYPDPVRVVAVGGESVQQMLDRPEDSKWEAYSVEFCGGTHMANSSEAKRFALLSEEGLGRGVRRVVGLTFEKAEQAFAVAAELAARVDAAEKLSGAQLTNEVAELSRQLETAVVPCTNRKAMLGKVAALKKKLVEASKGNAKANIETAKAEAASMADAAAAEGSRFVVGLLQCEADAKVVEAAAGAVIAQLPDVAVLMLGAGKAACGLAVVPAPLQPQLDAKEWVNHALAVCGGKGGGKPGRAQAAARDASNIQGALAAAKSYAEEKLSG